MAGFWIQSVLVTGANRGIGLGLVQHFLGMPAPPQWVFAACRAPTGQRAQELQRLASKHRNLAIIPLAFTQPGWMAVHKIPLSWSSAAKHLVTMFWAAWKK